jgi:hypothetical protein
MLACACSEAESWLQKDPAARRAPSLLERVATGKGRKWQYHGYWARDWSDVCVVLGLGWVNEAGIWAEFVAGLMFWKARPAACK